jgi:hypothetical protein
MSKKDKKHKNEQVCSYCGQSPAYWQRAAQKYLCTKHASRFLKINKVLLTVTVVATIFFVFFYNPKLQGPVQFDVVNIKGSLVAVLIDSSDNIRLQYFDKLNKKKVRSFIDSNVKEKSQITTDCNTYDFLADKYQISVSKTDRTFKVYSLLLKTVGKQKINNLDKYLQSFTRVYNKKQDKRKTLLSSF